MANISKEDREKKDLDKKKAKVRELDKQNFIAGVNAKAQGKDLAIAAAALNEKVLRGVATDAEKKLIKSLLKVLGT